MIGRQSTGGRLSCFSTQATKLVTSPSCLLGTLSLEPQPPFCKEAQATLWRCPRCVDPAASTGPVLCHLEVDPVESRRVTPCGAEPSPPAELCVTRFALHQLRGLQAHLLQLAHGLAGGRRAPSPTGVQEHLWGARQEGRVRPRRQRGSRPGPRGHPRARVRFTRRRAGPTAPTGRGWLTADPI